MLRRDTGFPTSEGDSVASCPASHTYRSSLDAYGCGSCRCWFLLVVLLSVPALQPFTAHRQHLSRPYNVSTRFWISPVTLTAAPPLSSRCRSSSDHAGERCEMILAAEWAPPRLRLLSCAALRIARLSGTHPRRT
jgi:hypothetical protein